jgi:uncharacterized protein YgbK (DUF1537 family)
MEKQELWLGCVADDFTGAGDAASFLSEHGLRTILFNGIPAAPLPPAGCGAVVISLKTRSIPSGEAVSQSLAALQWLAGAGARQLYLKYCSTFDSTPAGNIGPVADAAMEWLDVPYTLLCPALPVNGRTVQGGTLYVHGVPLAESPMKDHPLNPMWDSSIARLMAPQSAFPCLTLTAQDLGEPQRVHEMLTAFGRDRQHFYVVPDYETDGHGRQIAALFGDCRLLTGGSGLLAHLAERHAPAAKPTQPAAGTAGRGIALCGSCSQASRAQIEHFKSGGGFALAVDPAELTAGTQSVDAIWTALQARSDEDALVYSVGAERPGELGPDLERNARLMEAAMAELGRRAAAAGYTRIIVAGGETSGAVTQALGQRSFFIGQSVAPGVPMMTPVEWPALRLVLKSGNFGQPDFFERAFAMTREGQQ